MNSVHEPGSRTMSKNLTQKKYRVKSGQKQAECTECTALGQPARLPSPRRAPAAPLPRSPRAPCAPAHCLRVVPARLAPTAPLPRAPRAPAPCLRTQRPHASTHVLRAPTPCRSPRMPAACCLRAPRAPVPCPRACCAPQRLLRAPAPAARPSACLRTSRAPCLPCRAPSCLARAVSRHRPTPGS